MDSETGHNAAVTVPGSKPTSEGDKKGRISKWVTVFTVTVGGCGGEGL